MSDEREIVCPTCAHRLRDYSQYLKTPHWRCLRERILKTIGYKCLICGSEVDLCVHHKNYNLWREKDGEDVFGLCEVCHKQLHDKKKKGELEAWLEQRTKALDEAELKNDEP